MLANLNIGPRLYLAFGAVIATLAVLVTIAYRSMGALDAANDMNIHTYQVIGEAKAVLESLINIETGQRGFALTGNDASLEPLSAGQRAFREHLDKARALTADNPAQQTRLTELEQAQAKWLREAIEPSIARRRAVATGAATLENVAELEQQGRGKAAMDAMRRLIAAIGDAEAALLKERQEHSDALQARTKALLIGGGVLAAAFAAAVAWWLAHNISGPLGAAVRLAESVAQGDLTSRIEARSRDEIGALTSALATMNAALTGIVGDVRQGTEAIQTASAEIAAGNLDLSARTEQQAGSLEETASSMEQLTSTVKQNVTHARDASRMAADVSQAAAQGGALVDEVVRTMAQISGSSARIVDIISVIDGIAFQTNILALNAAVEAARAGEQGRGFAVVAGEVRSLAQRAAAAAKEIGDLIGQSVSDVRAGSELVEKAGTTMRQLVTGVQDVDKLIGEISRASEEQFAGIEQVNTAIAQMDNVTQQNAALVEQAAAAANAMREQAARLADTVRVFVIDRAPGPASASLRPLSLPR